MTIAEALKVANKALVKNIESAMKTEVVKAVKAEEAAVIDEVVYGVYEPKMYVRRKSRHGLSDPANMRWSFKTVGESTIVEVENLTLPNATQPYTGYRPTVDKNLAQLIEYGHGDSGMYYDYPKDDAAFMEPRPFTKKTIENLKYGDQIDDALRAGLRRQGIKTE